jgi:hypothetical protein
MPNARFCRLIGVPERTWRHKQARARTWVLKERLWAFSRDCAAAELPETTRRARTDDLVVAHPGRPAARGHQRQDRGVQPGHQRVKRAG